METIWTKGKTFVTVDKNVIQGAFHSRCSSTKLTRWAPQQKKLSVSRNITEFNNNWKIYFLTVTELLKFTNLHIIHSYESYCKTFPTLSKTNRTSKTLLELKWINSYGCSRVISANRELFDKTFEKQCNTFQFQSNKYQPVDTIGLKFFNSKENPQMSFE